MKSKHILFLLTFLFSFHFLKSQDTNFPKDREKVYLQTNHVYYKPGESVFYKLNTVNGSSFLPSTFSKVVRVQLIEPSGNIKYINVHEIINGGSSGSFFLPEGIVGGIYKLKAYTNFQKNETPNLIFEKEINVQKIVSPRLLMKVDFLKKGFQPGEDVEVDFTIKSLQNLPISFYEGVYIINLNGEKWQQSTFLTNKEGKARINFKLPSDLKTDDGLLSFQFAYDGFNETISKPIPINIGNVDVKLLPEGGFLLGEIENTVAFKATNDSGKPVDFKGEIIDENNQIITTIETLRFGMGKFKFKPEVNKNYFLKYQYSLGKERRIPLPKAVFNTAKIEVATTNGVPQFDILSTSDDEIKLEMAFRNQIIESRNIKVHTGKNPVDIDLSKFPMGIARFTLYKNSLPLSERVVFVNRDRQMKLEIDDLKQECLPREKVKLKIRTLDFNNNPIPAELAFSVVDDKLWTYADDRQNTILSWFTLSSELSGKIEEPNFYFKKEEKQSLELLDLVMLTNGYRYFQWNSDVLKSEKLAYEIEQKNGIYGIVVDEENNPIKSDVYLYEYISEEKGEIVKRQTANDGRFYFSNINSDRANKIIAKAAEPKKKVQIKVLSYSLNSNPLIGPQKKSQKEVDEIIGELKKQAELEKSEDKKRPNSTYNSRKDSASTKMIEEVITLGYGYQKKTSYAGASSTVNSSQEIPTTVLAALQGHVAGIQVSSFNGQPGNASEISVRGISSLANSGKPLIVVDGVIKDKLASDMNSSEIQSVTILKDEAATAIYGSRAADGVIIINLKNRTKAAYNWTLNKESQYDVFTIDQNSLIEFSQARRFAYPIYETTETPFRYDYRETIYWNPIVQTDKKGNAEIEFYNSDANTTFRILGEGISSNGLLGRVEQTYTAQSSIAIDAKIPPYLTMADEPIIPVVIKNNSKATKTIQVLPMVSKVVELKPHDSIAVLKPLESTRLQIPLKTGAESNSNLSLISTSDQLRETMILPFKVEKKGFIIKEEIIASRDTIFSFQIKDPIDGTLRIEARMFENASTKLLTDIERLKREPYGCFEQLSSTIYPNIFILDYLKHFKLTESFEKEVIKNMRIGYTKLATYELPGGGFGYFHSSNSNIGVSAFALLEFSELSKLVHVNPRMLERTKNYLLKQRNGRGTFNGIDYLSKTFYKSEYGWATHSYVVYSLAKSGFKNEVVNEFDLALSRVLQTKDFYQMAVLANAAFELGKTKEYAVLLEELGKQMKSNTMKLGTSFTGSSGGSLKSESLSFYLLAYVKSQDFHDSVASEIVNRINMNADRYGYGSSQATGLVIQALAEYYKKVGFKVEDSKIQKIYFNDEELKMLPSIPKILTKLAKENNKIQIISPNKRTLPYTISYEYASLQAPKNENSVVEISSSLQKQNMALGETNRIKIEIRNKLSYNLPMVTAKIGIPAGLTLEPAVLKNLLEKKQFSYYEIFDNYLVLYWETMNKNEVKTINLDVKAEFPGKYIGKNSNVYLFYAPENASYNDGLRVTISP